MKTYMQLVSEAAKNVSEVFPWDVQENNDYDLIVDVREPYEFAVGKIKNSINVPRGVLEPACEDGYEETVDKLVHGRDEKILLACRSGYRSILAAFTMQMMGFNAVFSLKLGIKGWFEYELPLINENGVTADEDALGKLFGE